MDKSDYRSIDEYIEAFPAEVQKALREIRSAVRRAAPQAKEKISYKMPAFELYGNLVYFAAFKKHVGFYPTPHGMVAYEKELAGYKQGKGSVQFPLDRPMPLELIEKIVATRVEENIRKREDRAKSKKS
jgi:uncharacterized protein YdhG (YjbR/CyaY superfamily)